MANKNSSSFSCLPCFSGNTQPFESACPSPNAVTREEIYVTQLPFANPNACSEAQSSSSANAADNSNVSPADATVPSGSTSPFQASTSHGASSSSSAEAASTSAVLTQDAPASGRPSSSFPTKSVVIKNILEAAAVDEENGIVNLEGLIQHISDLLDFIRGNKLGESSDLPKLQKPRNLSEGFDLECLGLLKELNRLAKYIKQLKERPQLREEMEDLIKEALEMIAKAAIMCCSQINTPKISKFFSTSANNEELLEFQRELEKIYNNIKNQFNMYIYDGTVRLPTPLPTPLEPEYPDYAVGIEESLKEVIELLEWDSDKNALAVILHGPGEVGKSTLADAVFARLYFEGRKYSKVRLFDDIPSIPNIVEKQKLILTDLMVGIAQEKMAKRDVRTFEQGQLEISRMLEKQVAFLYIDNVLDGDRLEQLLPRDMHRAKRVRVLITARNKSVSMGCRMETKFYAMNGLPKATSLSKKEMNEGELASSQSGFHGYDVFVNHRGPDTKKTFSSYLYHRLLLHGLKPFLDKQELQEGLNFPTQIVGAIRNASVHVAIFSPTYAKSQWCLEELLFMRESRAPIIPVFYHVEPAELRWTDQNKNGVYARGLHELQLKKTYDHQIHQEKSRYDPITIQNWRDALSSVADISGFDLDGAFNGDEGLMLEKVVESVLKVIKKPRTYAPNIPLI